MKKIVLILSIVSIFLIAFVTKNDADAIIVYASSEQFRNEELQEQLNKQFPNLNVRVMYTATAKAAAKLSVENTGTDADIIVGLETSYISKITDSLADISEFTTLNYLEDLTVDKQDNKYVVWERQAGGIIVNKEILEKNNLPIPKTYDDLLDPIYKGFISMPDPKSSGTGYFVYLNMVNTRGEEGALEYFDALSKNIKQFTESGSGPIKLLTQGEVAIGLSLTFQAVNYINNNVPLEIIYPEEGSPYSLTGTALVKGRETNDDIVDVFKFIANDFMVYDKTYFSPEQVLVDQVNNIPNYPKDINYADMRRIEDIDFKEYLLSIWKY